MAREVPILPKLNVNLSLPKTCIYQSKHKHMLLKNKIVINIRKDMKNFNKLNKSKNVLSLSFVFYIAASSPLHNRVI